MSDFLTDIVWKQWTGPDLIMMVTTLLMYLLAAMRLSGCWFVSILLNIEILMIYYISPIPEIALGIANSWPTFIGLAISVYGWLRWDAEAKGKSSIGGLYRNPSKEEILDAPIEVKTIAPKGIRRLPNETRAMTLVVFSIIIVASSYSSTSVEALEFMHWSDWFSSWAWQVEFYAPILALLLLTHKHIEFWMAAFLGHIGPLSSGWVYEYPIDYSLIALLYTAMTIAGLIIWSQALQEQAKSEASR